MYIIIDEEGQNFTGEDIQQLIKIVKKDGYGPVDCWDIYEATKVEVVESYTVKKPTAPKTTVAKKPVAKK